MRSDRNLRPFADLDKFSKVDDFEVLGLIDLAKPEAEFVSLQEFAQDVIFSLVLLSVPAQPSRGEVELPPVT